MVRLAISSIACNEGFCIEAVEDIKTAVEEACKYISCHGYDSFSDKYELECNAGEGYLEIIVTDKCDKHSFEQMTESCKEYSEEGYFGIVVIKALMNEVEVVRDENNRKQIKMVKKL